MAQTARPDLIAYEQQLRLPLPDLVAELARLLGDQLVAYLGDVKETRAVRQWASGTREIRDATTERRLRLALHVALMLSQHESPKVIQAWFQGLNPQIGDQSPARLLRDEPVDETGPLVLAAARAFLVGG